MLKLKHKIRLNFKMIELARLNSVKNEFFGFSYVEVS